ncbi:TOBE domain-containing protein, partial [Shinella sumterensis]
FVAGFIGSPRMNFVKGESAKPWNAPTVGIRPEHIRLSKDAGTWKGVVGVAEHLGSDTFLHVNVEGVGMLTVRADGDFPVTHGDIVHLTPDDGRIHRFDESDKAIR